MALHTSVPTVADDDGIPTAAFAVDLVLQENDLPSLDSTVDATTTGGVVPLNGICWYFICD